MVWDVIKILIGYGSIIVLAISIWKFGIVAEIQLKHCRPAKATQQEVADHLQTVAKTFDDAKKLAEIWTYRNPAQQRDFARLIDKLYEFTAKETAEAMAYKQSCRKLDVDVYTDTRRSATAWFKEQKGVNDAE